MDQSNAHSAVVMSENNAHAPPQDQSNAAAAPVDQELTLSCESEYKDYKYNEKVDIWSLISLKAPAEPEDDNEEKRPPVDLVAVIDKSGSMAGQKLNLVKKTLEFVLTQLKDKDRLSVVTYDTQVYLDFPLRKMDKDGKEFAAKKVEAIRDGSTTNLSGGLLKGLCQMIERKEKNEVASVLLFTDGLANAGITNAEGIVAAMKDPTRFSCVAPQPQLQFQQNILPQQPAPHQGWLRNVFGGRGNQNAAPQPQMQVQQMEVDPPASLPPVESSPEKKTTDATVYTFGFGDDHDPNMLTKISDAGNGMYYYIENEDKIAESFAHCLGGLMSTVGQGIQLHVNLEQGVTIKNVHTVKPFERISDQSVKIDMGDLQAEERRDIVLELTLDAVPQPYSSTPQLILKAQVDYFNVLTNQLGSKQSDLSVFRPETTEEHDEAHAHKEVGKQKYRHKMTKAMEEATREADSGNFQGAKMRLRSEMASLKSKSSNSSVAADVDYYANMSNDLEMMSDQMSSASAYRSKGNKLQSNMMQQYQAQRSSNLDSNAFAKKGHAKKRAAAKSFMKK